MQLCALRTQNGGNVRKRVDAEGVESALCNCALNTYCKDQVFRARSEETRIPAKRRADVARKENGGNVNGSYCRY